MSYLGKTPSQGTRNRFYFTASGGETSISGADDNGNTLTFADGAFVDVSKNGLSLVAGTDYNTSTSNTIAGLTALSASDVIEIVAYDVFNIFSGSINGGLNVSETVTASAFSGDGSALTGITLTSLGIPNHDQVTVTAGGDVTVTGGVYLGGTGSDNYLSDYEQGLFTPTVSGVTLTSAAGRYTKIGRTVFVEMFMRFPTTSDSTTTSFGSLPFTPDNGGSNTFFGGVSVVRSISTHVRNRTQSNGIFARNASNSNFTNASFSGQDVTLGGWYTTS